MGASVAAAVVIRKQRELIERFRHFDATRPERARSIDELGVDTRMVWAGLLRDGVIRESATGLFFLDEAAWAQHQRDRRRRLVIVLTVVAAATVAILLLRR
jgi:hypothetical protein